MAYRNADHITAKVRHLMDEPGAVLEYRADTGEVLGLVENVRGVLYAKLPTRGRRGSIAAPYKHLGQAAGRLERELVKRGVPDHSWTRVARSGFNEAVA